MSLGNGDFKLTFVYSVYKLSDISRAVFLPAFSSLIKLKIIVGIFSSFKLKTGD